MSARIIHAGDGLYYVMFRGNEYGPYDSYAEADEAAGMFEEYWV